MKSNLLLFDRPAGVPGYDDGIILARNLDNTYQVEFTNGTIDNKVLAGRIAIPPRYILFIFIHI